MAKTILEKARRGSRVVYVTGNHDEMVHDHVGTYFAGIDVVDEAMREPADGGRTLIRRGDDCDNVIRYAP